MDHDQVRKKKMTDLRLWVAGCLKELRGLTWSTARSKGPKGGQNNLYESLPSAWPYPAVASFLCWGCIRHCPRGPELWHLRLRECWSSSVTRHRALALSWGTCLVSPAWLQKEASASGAWDPASHGLSGWFCLPPLQCDLKREF